MPESKKYTKFVSFFKFSLFKIRKPVVENYIFNFLAALIVLNKNLDMLLFVKLDILGHILHMSWVWKPLMPVASHGFHTQLTCKM